MIDTAIFQIGNVPLSGVLSVSYRGCWLGREEQKKKVDEHKAILKMQSCRVVQM